MVGTGRLFSLPIEEPLQLVRYGRRLGQDLFDPPNVKGWPGVQDGLPPRRFWTGRRCWIARYVDMKRGMSRHREVTPS